MLGADIVMFYQSGTTWVCSDMYATGYSAPLVDTRSDIVAWGASRTAGVLRARFIRRRNTGDTAHDLAFDPYKSEVLAAYHSTSNVPTNYHTFRIRANLTRLRNQSLPPNPAPTGRIITTLFGGLYVVSSKLTSTTLDVAIAVTTTGWAAFGVRAPGAAGSMDGADIYRVREAAAGVYVLEDLHGVGYMAPVLDSKFSVTQWGVQRSGAVLYMRFTRKLNTADAQDVVVALTGQEFLAAMHRTSSVATSIHTDRTRFFLGVTPAAAPAARATTGTTLLASLAPETLILVHAVLMLLAFPVVLLAGMYVARFATHKDSPVHWVLQTVGTLLSLAGFAVIVAHVHLYHGADAHFAPGSGTSFGAHPILGLICMVAMAINVVLGVVAQCRRSKWRPSCFPVRTHHWLGRAVLLAACVNVFLGMWHAQTWMVYELQAGAWAGYSFYLACAVALFILLECRRSAKSSADVDLHYVEMKY